MSYADHASSLLCQYCFGYPLLFPAGTGNYKDRVIKSNEEAGKINFSGLSPGLGSAWCFLFLFCSLVMVLTCKEHAIFLRSAPLQKAIHALCSELTLASLGKGLSHVTVGRLLNIFG